LRWLNHVIAELFFGLVNPENNICVEVLYK
jgi:hypothetical protein